MPFSALLLTRSAATEGAEPQFSAAVTLIDESQLPGGDANVLVRLRFSSLNYKDGLAICNKGPVVRSWPMVAGIDGAGEVLESGDPRWRPGDRVILNGFGVGETHWGCLAEKARLKPEWLVRLPEGMTEKQAMAIGTAGYTAMLCVMRIEGHGVKPGDGEVLVTGATGGVGSVAIAILKNLGYTVVAATGKLDEAGYLKQLGASDVIDRATLSMPGKPLQKERWSAVVDTVGSHTLANACAQTRYGGIVTACGLAQGADLPSTVMPFILRSVTLAGVDSVMAPLPTREAAWQRLSRDLPKEALEAMTAEITLAEAPAAAARLMQAAVRGRYVVRIA